MERGAIGNGLTAPDCSGFDSRRPRERSRKMRDEVAPVRRGSPCRNSRTMTEDVYVCTCHS